MPQPVQVEPYPIYVNITGDPDNPKWVAGMVRFVTYLDFSLNYEFTVELDTGEVRHYQSRDLKKYENPTWDEPTTELKHFSTTDSFDIPLGGKEPRTYEFRNLGEFNGVYTVTLEGLDNVLLTSASGETRGMKIINFERGIHSGEIIER